MSSGIATSEASASLAFFFSPAEDLRIEQLLTDYLARKPATRLRFLLAYEIENLAGHSELEDPFAKPRILALTRKPSWSQLLLLRSFEHLLASNNRCTAAVRRS